MPSKKDKPIVVKVIEASGGTALVEWTDEVGCLARGYLPAEAVESGSVSKDELEMAVPYGLQWEHTIVFSPAAFACELRRCGIWTKEDLERNQTAAIRALRVAYGISMRTLKQQAALASEVEK